MQAQSRRQEIDALRIQGIARLSSRNKHIPSHLPRLARTRTQTTKYISALRFDLQLRNVMNGCFSIFEAKRAPKCNKLKRSMKTMQLGLQWCELTQSTAYSEALPAAAALPAPLPEPLPEPLPAPPACRSAPVVACTAGSMETDEIFLMVYVTLVASTPLRSFQMNMLSMMNDFPTAAPRYFLSSDVSYLCMSNSGNNDTTASCLIVARYICDTKAW